MGAVVIQCPLWGESVLFGPATLAGLKGFSLLGRYANQGRVLEAGPCITFLCTASPYPGASHGVAAQYMVSEQMSD